MTNKRRANYESLRGKLWTIQTTHYLSKDKGEKLREAGNPNPTSIDHRLEELTNIGNKLKLSLG
jgi:hypothetical protein